MGSIAALGIILTVSIYGITLLLTGGGPFNDIAISDDDCDGFFDCLFEDVGNVFAIIGSLFQFLSLQFLRDIPHGDGSTGLDGTFVTVLQFAMTLVWGLIIMGFIRGAHA